MKCQICRERDANIVFTKIVNNDKMVLHICLECAKKKGLTIEISHLGPLMNDTGTPSQNTGTPVEFMQHGDEGAPTDAEHLPGNPPGFFGAPASAVHTSGNLSNESPVPDLTCDRCGTKFAEFKKTGFFGCDRCHEVFGRYFVNIIKQIHGSTTHEGKAPLGLQSEVVSKKHLRTLRMRLKRCIESEEYERAAELRDKIASLEGKLSNQNT